MYILHVFTAHIHTYIYIYIKLHMFFFFQASRPTFRPETQRSRVPFEARGSDKANVSTGSGWM